MAQLPVVPRTSQVILNWNIQGQDCRNVLHYQGPPTQAAPIASEIGPPLAALFTPTFWGQFAVATVLNSITVIPLDLPNQAGSDYNTGFPIHGTVTGTAIASNQVAALISWKTALRGRSYRGRTYLGGLTNTAVQINSLSATAVAAIQTFANGLLTLVGSRTSNLVVVSYFNANVMRGVGVATQVTSGVVRPEVATQRRRMP